MFWAILKHHDPPICNDKVFRWKYGIKIFNVNVEIARFYNVYSPNEDDGFGNVIGIWREKVRLNKPLTIVGDGNQKRDFTHVDDIIDGILKIVFSIKHIVMHGSLSG